MGDRDLNSIKLKKELSPDLVFLDGGAWQDPAAEVTATSPFAVV